MSKILLAAGTVILAGQAVVAAQVEAPRPVRPMRVAFAEGYTASSDGVKIHYLSGGDGPAALLFVHGWSCDASYWQAQMKGLASSYRVAALDLAGHGVSGTDRKAWTMQAFGEDVRAVADALELRRIVLVGHSMGGAVILEAARLLGDRVVLLVGADTLQDIEDNGTPEQRDSLLGAMQKDFRGFVRRQFVPSMFPKTADAKLVERIAADMASAPPEIAIAAFRELWAYDGRESMRALKVPLVCINADLWPTKAENNRKYARDFSVILMPGASHFVQLERPAEFNRLLAQVLHERALDQ